MSVGNQRASLVVLALGFIPALGSLWFATGDEETPALAITKSRSALVFATYLYHHGDEPVRLDSTLESEFRFRNDGPLPVEFGEIERSCGCMNPRLTKKVLQPGEIGSLVVPIQTINQSPGPHEYSLLMHYSDPEPRETTLTIKAVFPEKMVVVQPTALFISQRTEQPADFDLSVSDFRTKPLSVSAVESTAWFVKASVHQPAQSDIVQVSHSETAQMPSAVTRITGTVDGSIPPGRHLVLLHAATNDAKFPMVTVPMMITGPVYPEGETPAVSPPQLQFVASRHVDAARQARVVVDIPESWQLTHASSWPEELTVEYKEVSGTDGRLKVVASVALDRLPDPAIGQGVVQFVANDGEDLITVPVTILHP